MAPTATYADESNCLIAGGADASAPSETKLPYLLPALPPRGLSDEFDATDHETRGLMNLVTLLSHCLLKSAATEGEKRGWRREVDEAARRLQELRLGLRPRR